MNKNLEKKAILVTKRKNDGEEQFHSLMFTDRLGRIVRKENKYSKLSETIEYYKDTDKIVRIHSTVCGEYFYDENGKLIMGKEYTKGKRIDDYNMWIYMYDDLGRIIQIIKGFSDSIYGNMDQGKEIVKIDAIIDGDIYTFNSKHRKTEFTYFPNSSRKNRYKDIYVNTDRVLIDNFYNNDIANKWYSISQFGKKNEFIYDENGLTVKRVSYNERTKEKNTIEYCNRIFDLN